MTALSTRIISHSVIALAVAKHRLPRQASLSAELVRPV